MSGAGFGDGGLDPARRSPPVWRAWVAAARPPTLPAAVVPVLVGTAAAFGPGASGLRIGPFVAAMLASLLIQIGTNYANDAFDFWKSADTEERLGPRRLIQGGLATPGQVFIAACACFGLAAVIGLYLIAIAGWPILVIGVFSILSAVAYTGGPFPLAYHGLGDVFVFVFFGPVAVLGSAYLQRLTVPPEAVIASLPVGLLVTNILVVNNLRDIETDRAAGKRTLAVRIGRAGTRLQYILSVAVAFLAPLVYGLVRLDFWLWLPLLTLPFAVRLVRTVVASTDGPVLNVALKGTGQLHLLFGILLAIGFWLS